MNDPIIDELEKQREDYARKFNYDSQLIFEDIKKRQEEMRRKGIKFVKSNPKIIQKNEAA